MKKYSDYIYKQQSMKAYLIKPAIRLPKTRASKITQFKHYQTDAPV